MKLYSYFRSSAAYRLRIALNLKGLDYDYVAVNLLETEQKSDAYLALNPQGLVPAMELADGVTLGQSIALLAFLVVTVFTLWIWSLFLRFCCCCCCCC